MPDYDTIKRRLDEAGQSHLLAFWDELPGDRRRALLERLDAIELEAVPGLVERYVRDKPAFQPPAELAPAPYYPADPEASMRSWDHARFHALGEEMLRAGEVGVFTVAGGQGTRLGFDGPKGCYPGSAVNGKPLFLCIAEWILAGQRRYGATIPWYVMTSPVNHDQTVAFFRDQNYFGLKPQNVMHFQQGVMPSLDMRTGRVLLAEKDAPAVNPDGHGGSLRALHASGALEDMQHRGVRHISYTQVDNPICKAIDPLFLGLHGHAEDSSAEMSSKMISKTDPGEKVGVFCLADGKLQIVEYSDLPDSLANQRDDRGGLRFNAGSPAIHILGVEFVQRLNRAHDDGPPLPFHRAEKKVPYVDLETGEHVHPDEPNAVKLEMFVFDAIPLCAAPILLETERLEEFAPIKNAEGKDSPESSRRIQTERAARWLEANGVSVPRHTDGSPNCTIEISPLAAMRPEDLDQRPGLPTSIAPGAEIAIE
jgi:UDP-N-acetylglucosamine/UDP-N-acetylgalactosamine diphosphorylase